MEAYCRGTADALHFFLLHISHTISVMAMALTFHNNDPDGLGDALNTFLFPDLSPSSGSEAALLTRKWDAILGGGTLASFAETILLMGEQRSPPSQDGTKHLLNWRLGRSSAQYSWDMKNISSYWKKQQESALG